MMTRDAMRCGRMFSQKINVFVHTAEPSRTSWGTHVTGGRQRFPLSRIPRHAFPCTCGMHTPTPPCEDTPYIHSVCTLQGAEGWVYPHTPPCKLCHMHTPCAPHREGCLYLSTCMPSTVIHIQRVHTGRGVYRYHTGDGRRAIRSAGNLCLRDRLLVRYST